MEKEIERVYFSITEVSKKVGVRTSQIRYWTSYFKISSNRKYTNGDIEVLRRIKCLAETRLFTLHGMKLIIAGFLSFKRLK